MSCRPWLDDGRHVMNMMRLVRNHFVGSLGSLDSGADLLVSSLLSAWYLDLTARKSLIQEYKDWGPTPSKLPTADNLEFQVSQLPQLGSVKSTLCARLAAGTWANAVA